MRRATEVSPFLALPALAVIAMLVATGPDLWKAIYASVWGICLGFLNSLSPLKVLSLGFAFTVMAGLGASALVAIRELRRLRVLSSALADSGCMTLAGAGHLPSVLLVADSQPFAFCHGLLRPRIYVSTALVEGLSTKELRAVLCHEAVHARRRDPLRLLVAKLMAAAFFVIPLVRVIRDRYLVRLEVQADREVVRKLGLQPLAGALLKLLSLSPLPAQPACVGAFNIAQERVRRLLAEGGRESQVALTSRPVLLANGALLLAVAAGVPLIAQTLNVYLSANAFCRLPLA